MVGEFTYGLTVPLVLPRRSINFSLCAQVNYNMPYALSNFVPNTIATRDGNSFLDISRKKFYKYVITYLDSFGLDGEQCLLRSICEIAETPMHIKEEDTLLEKVVHYIFTPSLEMSMSNHNLTHKPHLKFAEKLLLAEKVGFSRGHCSEEYSDCIVSIVDLFSSKYII
ncbi:hypothetical protein NQ318_015082 [Aromia moschata]|uniref:Uncharacterized protein n=1 Tax=Aromia moschata TaxID=1265417 RepID=A0AAV8YX96_9CUCU|nr:hypothetical protein NQ318_015082 [Aromia moschata]